VDSFRDPGGEAELHMGSEFLGTMRAGLHRKVTEAINKLEPGPQPEETDTIKRAESTCGKEESGREETFSGTFHTRTATHRRVTAAR
jgi:hypothetical protein